MLVCNLCMLVYAGCELRGSFAGGCSSLADIPLVSACILDIFIGIFAL